MPESDSEPEQAYPVSPSLLDVTNRRNMGAYESPIFHYCSADAILTILKKKTLRFTDANCLNDGEEVIWAHRQINIALQRLRDRDEIPDAVPAVSKKFIDTFQEEWASYLESTRHFLCCFSFIGDSLSQWRAYADDARGFSIGFAVSDLDIPAKIYKVEYDLEIQQSEIVALIIAIFQEYKKDENYFGNQGIADLVHLFMVSCAYKNPAFVDEREVRASHLVGLHSNELGQRAFEFLGGVVAEKPVEEAQVEYRVSKGKLVPFVDFNFQLHSDCAIKEVWLGPRCATSEEEVGIFLRTMGYENVVIKAAGSRYR